MDFILDKIGAVRTYQRAARAELDIRNAAAEIKIRAERRVGELRGWGCMVGTENQTCTMKV